jgi:hypothetical protein
MLYIRNQYQMQQVLMLFLPEWGGGAGRYQRTESNVTLVPFPWAGCAGTMIAWLELCGKAEDTDGCLCLYLGIGGAGFLEFDGLRRQVPFPVAQALQAKCLPSHRVCPTPHERPAPPPRPLSPLRLNPVEQDFILLASNRVAECVPVEA